MANETSFSKKILEFLKTVSEEYHTGGIWISKRLGRRWSFWCGLEPDSFLPPQMLRINEDYALFCENKELLEKEWERLVRELETLIKGSTRECQ